MRTRLLTIVLAAVLALVGVVAILAYVRQANERAVAGLKAETVLAATGPISADTPLSQAWQQHLLSTEDVPVSSLAHAGPAVHAVTAANGSLVVSSAMVKGQVLFTDMLAPAGSLVPGSNGLAIPPTKSAISLDICVPEDVASYVTPGAKVAVFDILIPDTAAATTAPSCSPDHSVLGRDVIQNAGAISSLLVLPRVEVLAVGQNAGGQAASSSGVAAAAQPASSSSATDMLVTFAVDQQQAEQLMVLQQGGIPYLVLLGSEAAMNTSLGPAGL